MTYLYNSCGFPPRFLTIPQGLLCIIIDGIASKYRLCNLPKKSCIILTLYTATLSTIYRAVLPRYCGPQSPGAVNCTYVLYTVRGILVYCNRLFFFSNYKGIIIYNCYTLYLYTIYLYVQISTYARFIHIFTIFIHVQPCITMLYYGHNKKRHGDARRP